MGCVGVGVVEKPDSGKEYEVPASPGGTEPEESVQDPAANQRSGNGVKRVKIVRS
jgi:hypothetical protein